MTPQSPSPKGNSVKAPHNLKAIACAVLGFALFSVNDALVKLLASSGYSISQTLFWTAFFVCPVLIGYALMRGGWSRLHSNKWGWHMFRGVLMTALVFCNIYALIHIKITEFYAVIFTNPLSISLLSWLILKDKLSKGQLACIVLGFLAVLYMCRPGAGMFNMGVLSVFVGTIFFAFATVLVRSRLREESALLIGLSGPIVIVLVALPLMAILGEITLPFSAYDWAIFVVCGITAGFGGVFFGLGFQYASSAAVVAPFQFTQMIWGGILGYLLFSEIPSQNEVVGSVVIGGLVTYLIYAEAKARRAGRIGANSIQHEPV